MPCYFPLHGFKSKRLSVNGKRQFVFSRRAGFTDLPAMTVPCGQCIGCRIDRSREWALRCVHESKMHARCCFITLTYDDDYLPPGNTLQKTDLQKFFKRLRKNVGPFRYFACGEYGDTLQRPHYHAIIFGLDFSFDRKRYYVNKQGHTLFTSHALTNNWGMGHCTVGPFSYQTAAYTARYIMKKQIGKHGGEHENYRRVSPDGEVFYVSREFCCMSLRPGLGSSWYELYSSDAFPSDFLVHEGKKFPVPRFYTNKLKEGQPYEYDLISTKRKKAREANAHDNTGDRLFTKFECKKSKISTLSRSLET